EKPQPTVTRLGTQGAQAGHAVGDGWIIFRAKTMGYFLFDKSCRRLRSFDLDLQQSPDRKSKIKRSSERGPSLRQLLPIFRYMCSPGIA
ncbi:hypothetical protein, partial [Pseudomonas sp. GL-R-19]|uniref:hypothetical protein n=1 Tax=Pseudomonas sp. GL-R-19 TaxID=2832391 RepID=UPI001CBAB404